MPINSVYNLKLSKQNLMEMCIIFCYSYYQYEWAEFTVVVLHDYFFILKNGVQCGTLLL